jgi:hypothetical protein
MITEKYKGVEIAYSEKGNQWEFTYDGQERVAPSLALAKKRIDTKPKFKRIPCWCTERYGGDDFLQGEVTCLTDDRCAWVNVKYGHSEHREKIYSRNVYPRNQFNDLLVGRIGALRKEIAALEKQIEAETEKLQGLPEVKKEEA